MLLLLIKGEMDELLFNVLLLVMIFCVFIANLSDWNHVATGLVVFLFIIFLILTSFSLRRIIQNYKILKNLVMDYPSLKGSRHHFFAQLDFYDHETQLAFHDHYLISFFERIQLIDLEHIVQLSYRSYKWKQYRGGTYIEHFLDCIEENVTTKYSVHFARVPQARLYRLVNRLFPSAKEDYSENLTNLNKVIQGKFPALIISLKDNNS